MAGDNTKRASWASSMEFILTCVGYAVGLGNIWRFPYFCYENGGGAFMIPYLLILFLCGLPMACIEFSMGQYVGLASFQFWDICPIVKGLGALSVIMNLLMPMYVAFVIALAFNFLVFSFSAELPWKSCGHEWNTPQCNDGNNNISNIFGNITSRVNVSMFNASVISINQNESIVSPAEEYLINGVLRLSSGISDIGSINWLLLIFLAVAWILIYLPVIYGIKSYGKVVYVTAIFPYVMLTIFVIRGAMLPGSLEGIKYYMMPKWEKLLDFKVWYNAASQIFFSLGIGFGVFITMASYNKFNNNCIRDAVVATFVNSATSIYAGFAVFSVLGFMAHEANVDIEQVIQSGPGLAFIVYPRALATMPLSQFWSVMFFLMLIVLGISSETIHLETIISCLVDQHPVLRKPVWRVLTGTIIVIVIMALGVIFTTEAGMYWFTLVDTYALTFGLTIGTILECIVFAWIYGLPSVCKNMHEMTGIKPNWYFKICWKLLSPLLLFLILIMSIVTWKPVTYNGYVFQLWTTVVGWCLAMLPIIPLPVMAIYSIITVKGITSFKQKLKVLTEPTDEMLKYIKQRIEAAHCQNTNNEEMFQLKENHCKDDTSV